MFSTVATNIAVLAPLIPFNPRGTPMSNALSAQGATFLRVLEGFVDHFYADAGGVGTIGIGFTWASGGFREWWTRNRPGLKFGPGAKMTREEADRCLIFICEMEYGKAVRDFLGKTVKQSVFDGMVSPVFNLGPVSLAWKWAASVKAGDLSDGAARLRNTGTTADGKVLSGLVKRRREEAELIEHGDYKIGGIVDSDPLADGIMRRGERGKPVMNVQEALARRGLYAGKIDGIFGYGTEAAVLEFQRTNELKADGIAGPATLTKLGEGLNDLPKPRQSLLGLIIDFILSLFKKGPRK